MKKVIYAFLIFTLLLALQSSEFYYSIKGYSQVFFSLMMLPVGFTLIDSEIKFNRINRQYIWVIFISVIITAIGYIFNVGKVFNYGADEQRIGPLGSAGLYSGAVCLAMLPIILKGLRRRIFFVFTFIASIILYIFILLNVRRTAILIPIVGIVAYILTTDNKIKYLSYVLSALLLIFLASVWYGDTLQKRFSARQAEGRFEKQFYRTEARFQELVSLTDAITSFSDPIAVLAGVGHNIYAEHVENNKIVKRMYHTDIGKLMYGSGLFGLGLYLWLSIGLFFMANPGNKVRDLHIRKIQAMIFAIAAINIAIMLNGSLNLINLKSIIFLYSGALLRMYYNHIYSVKSPAITNGSPVPLSGKF